jgi:hypothetical protein
VPLIIAGSVGTKTGWSVLPDKLLNKFGFVCFNTCASSVDILS